jgi:ribosomal protein S18 acetylase RimI-like enzyme
MLNRRRGATLLATKVTRKGRREETNYDYTLSDETIITVSSLALADCAQCYHLGEKLFQFSPSLSRTFDKYVVIGCYSSGWEYCFVAKDNDKIIGFILGSLIEKERTSFGYLNWVAVEPFYQVCK